MENWLKPLYLNDCIKVNLYQSEYSSVTQNENVKWVFWKCAHLTVLDFFQRAVCPDSEECLWVRRDGHTCVTARLEDALRLTRTGESIPLIHGPVHATRHKTTVLYAERYGPHLKYINIDTV